MVYFKDKSSPSDEHHLIILDDQHQPVDKGTMLVVYAPLVGGKNVNSWPRLTNSSHLGEWCQEVSLSKNIKAWTLRATHHKPLRHQQLDDLVPFCTFGRSIIEGETKWDGDLRFTIEFRYTKGYWEWTEDVLSRCGDKLRHLKRWLTAEEALFCKLCIEGSLKEEAYLAAYLACWLCMFVLPGKDVNSIRPSTFKMASLMASDRRVNLAVPVLASVYEGLNTVATSPKPALPSPSFRIHFVDTCLACYFKTHYPVWQELRGSKMTRFSGEVGAKYYDPREARKRIHKTEFVSWVCNMLVKNGPSSLLMMTMPKSSNIITLLQFVQVILLFVKAASSLLSHIVPIDFGFNLGTIKNGEPSNMTRASSLKEGLRYWRLCVLSKSSSKAWFPCLPTNAKKLCSEAYKAW
ncbi:UNVERIFIED_CONTAM: hypothetical protein Scaly_0839000 [Sesamum calycinum]|uniref:Aminotransferase-like plant mobile domain-containing protein n=1 Tax=Sesamum calycinum TaxID=2727403 RepID=A0AAW2RB07_9LAMI